MSDFNYESWWSLHLRFAKDESLSDQESSAYELGLTRLEGWQESGDKSLTYLLTLRAAINRAAALHADLAARSVALDKKIAALESTYQQQTGQVLDLIYDSVVSSADRRCGL